MSYTRRLIFTTSVACIASVQYGYHMSELNGPSAVLSCQIDVPTGTAYMDTWMGKLGLKQCLSMDDQGIGLVTSIFSIGGLVASVYASWLTDLIGRRYCMALNGLVFVAGGLVEFFSNAVWVLALGRFISGLGAGCSIVITPLLINEISPHELKGFLGSMNQVAINLGILLTQVLAIGLANSIQWRYLLLVGAILGALNTLGSLFIDESPKWLLSKGRTVQAKRVLQRLRKTSNPELIDQEIATLGHNSDEEHALLDSNTHQKKPIHLKQYITDPLYKNSFYVVTAILANQQFCGINSIIFYGVGTIRKLLPNYAVAINCFISLGNAVITFLAAPFIDKYGRIPCLMTSVSIMGASSVLIALGILNSVGLLSVLATFTYVASFAIGLGPIPFLMISEVTQNEAKSAAQSYGTVINWIATFIVGYFFPILDSYIGGYTYLVFAMICVLFVSYIDKYVPETKGHKTYEDVWGLRVD